MLGEVKGYAWIQHNVEKIEFQRINVEAEVGKEGETFANIADIIAEVWGNG